MVLLVLVSVLLLLLLLEQETVHRKITGCPGIFSAVQGFSRRTSDKITPHKEKEGKALQQQRLSTFKTSFRSAELYSVLRRSII